ncbi:MAG TPA: hypothetical protein VLJ83_11115 [Gemmatimonadaceae bacterium]|nr:hypothetical protein [Gemmatimonadaceae bacterium]
MKTNGLFVTLVGIALVAGPVSSRGQQVSDTAFVGASFTPSFAIGGGPRVAIDQAHYNFHTATGRYLPFARFLRRDGFVVDSFTTNFSDASLRGVGVLVIANALAPENARRWVVPIRPAFTRSETIAVRDWVRGGGALLLIADHMPFAGAVHDLAREFGVDVIDGFALREPGHGGIVTFRRADSSLRASAVTDGRSAAERIDSVTTFTGNAFRAVDQSVVPLFVFGSGVEVLTTDSAWVFNDRTRHQPADGLLQAAAVQFGKGRVVITGEAALFSAQVTGPARRPMGMNAPGAEQNPQFLLNVMRWLSRVY